MSSDGLRAILLNCSICGFYWEPFGKSGFNVCTSCGCDWRYLDQVVKIPAWIRRLKELEGDNYLRTVEFGRKGWL